MGAENRSTSPLPGQYIPDAKLGTTRMRAQLKSQNPANSELVKQLVENALGIRKAVAPRVCKSRTEFVRGMANDIKVAAIREGKKVEDDKTYMAIAEQQLTSNQTRGYTSINDEVMFAVPRPSDM